MLRDNERNSSRRRLLKAVGAGALAGITLGAGNAAAGDVNPTKFCGTETKCSTYPCDQATGGRYLELQRECCQYADGSVECEPWSANGCC